MAIEYTSDVYEINQVQNLNPYKKQRRKELLLGYSLKEDSVLINSQNIFVGNYNSTFRDGRINAFSYGLMVEYKHLSESENSNDRWSIAPLFGNEFVLGKLKFGQQLGIYLVQNKRAPNSLLQQYYLRYLASERISTGITLKAHGRVADYLSIQLGIVLK